MKNSIGNQIYKINLTSYYKNYNIQRRKIKKKKKITSMTTKKTKNALNLYVKK